MTTIDELRSRAPVRFEPAIARATGRERRAGRPAGALLCVRILGREPDIDRVLPRTEEE